ncbi:MAG: photosystem II reaction center protein Ycf12 [Synechococcales cyanobacterium RM1_1_8]|nr:photosystem II reaction center protein Ycf12 [Synechococcales cyanobacterium RM1_1_8]
MFDFIGGINFEVIFQLVSLALIVIAGPVVVAVLAFQGGSDM